MQGKALLPHTILNFLRIHSSSKRPMHSRKTMPVAVEEPIEGLDTLPHTAAEAYFAQGDQ